MAKPIRIPLKMKNGALVRTLEELKENFDIESLWEYYESGKLLEWLESRCYDEEAQKVSELERGAENFSVLLCESLGLELEEGADLEFDSNFIKRRVEKREHLKTLTDDEEILSQVDSIAFTQEDLDTLIVMGEKKIYLCEGEFSVPLGVPDMTYIGLFHSCAVIKATDNVNFKERHIVFRNMPFFWDVSGLSESDQSYQAEKLFMAGRYKEAAEICKVLVKEDNPRAFMLLYRIESGFLFHRLARKIGEGSFDWIHILYYRTKKNRYKNAGIKLNSAYSLLDGNQWKNISRHKEVLRKIASEGTSFDKFYYGFLLYQEGLNTGTYDDEMIPIYQEAADLGNPCAADGLGNRYYNGQGVAQDYKKAFEWYLKAAEQGHVNAQNSIGACYYNGQGVTRDYKKAFEWYLKAAEQGHVDAQCDIGNCYYNGQGVVPNYVKAMEWYQKAAEQNYARAQNNIGVLYKKGRGVAKDYNKAMEWYQKAAKQGHALSQKNIGDLYYNGLGVSRDLQEAKKWYQKAADKGNSYAKDMLNKL